MGEFIAVSTLPPIYENNYDVFFQTQQVIDKNNLYCILWNSAKCILMQFRFFLYEILDWTSNENERILYRIKKYVVLGFSMHCKICGDKINGLKCPKCEQKRIIG